MQKLFLFSGVFLCFLFFLISFFHPIIIDYDLGRHLLFGKIMLQTDFVIKTNLISYTNSGFAYVNSHWLSGIIFIFSAKKFSVVPALLALCLYIFLLITKAETRPEIFSYVFLSIFIVILYKFRKIYQNNFFANTPGGFMG